MTSPLTYSSRFLSSPDSNHPYCTLPVFLFNPQGTIFSKTSVNLGTNSSSIEPAGLNIPFNTSTQSSADLVPLTLISNTHTTRYQNVKNGDTFYIALAWQPGSGTNIENVLFPDSNGVLKSGTYDSSNANVWQLNTTSSPFLPCYSTFYLTNIGYFDTSAQLSINLDNNQYEMVLPSQSQNNYFVLVPYNSPPPFSSLGLPCGQPNDCNTLSNIGLNTPNQSCSNGSCQPITCFNSVEKFSSSKSNGSNLSIIIWCTVIIGIIVILFFFMFT